MEFPHEKREVQSHGRSPGNGMTEMPLSRAPLATEGEATPGPDDYNPYDEREQETAETVFSESKTPTEGDDPYSFDDAGEELPDLELPDLGPAPSLNIDF